LFDELETLQRHVERLESANTALRRLSVEHDLESLGEVFDGLSLDMSYDTLALMYYATIQAVAYGTRHIIDAMEDEGYKIEQINACGGGTKNALWIQEHADATQRPIHLLKEPEAVLLGSAILGAVAAGAFPSIPDAMKEMCHAGEVVEPNTESKAYHDWKYGKQLEMYAQQVERRKS